MAFPDPEDMTRIYVLDFEDEAYDWKADFRTGQWENTAAVVESNCFGGSGRCLRMGLDPAVVDAITGLAGNGNPQLEWAATEIGSHDQVLLSFRFRVDNATWSGWRKEAVDGVGYDEETNEWVDDSYLGKLLYITDMEESTGALYMGSLELSFAANGAFPDFYQTMPYPWGPYYDEGGATYISPSNKADFSLATDGQWHTWRGYFDATAHTFQVEIDGVPFLSDNTESLQHGVIPLPEEFRMRGLQLFYIKKNLLMGGCAPDAPGEECGGQVDNFEVFIP